jgi:hypothetical protein
MENAPLLTMKEKTFTPAPVIVKKTTEASLGVKFVTAGMAACVADLITFPLDTAKVRLQIIRSKVRVPPGPPKQPLHCVV